MNNNQFATLSVLAEKGDWLNFSQTFLQENAHLKLDIQVEIIKKFAAFRNNLKPVQKINAKKWLINTLSTSWILEENKMYYSKMLVNEWLDFLNPDQLLSIAKLFWGEGNIEATKKILNKYWTLGPCLKNPKNEKMLIEITNQSHDPGQIFLSLSHYIEVGDQQMAKTLYQQFYRSYFLTYDLEDEKSNFWDLLWNKLNLINEKWSIWEMMKLDVGFLTDIMIKNKTKLQLPHFRKKREIANAILLRSEWNTFNSTLLKYFDCIEGSSLAISWLEILQREKKLLDFDSEQIKLKIRLTKPKVIPQGQKLQFEVTQNNTRIMESNTELNYSIDLVNIQNKVDSANSKESSHEIKRALIDNSHIGWKDKVNMLMLHEDYQSVLKIINENIQSLSKDDKIDFEVFTLEILLKTGQYQEVLKKLDSVWKDVQELEIFKIYKYVEGEALWMLNRKKEAVDCFRKVVDIDPSYKLAKWRLVEYNL